MKISPYLKINRALALEYLLVVAAFSTMVFMGGLFGARIVNKNIADYGDEVISASAETLKTYLKGHEITLDDIAFDIERTWASGTDAGKIEDELVLWTNWLHASDVRFTDFLYIYGVVDGVFIGGSEWDLPDDYVPQSRLWYIGATESSAGETYYSDPYIDAHTGENIMTLSRLLRNRDSSAFGVLGLDVFMSSITEYIGHMRLLNSGYGLLLDDEMRIIAHPDNSFIGTFFNELDGLGGKGYTEMSEMLLSGRDVSAFNYSAVGGETNVAFFQKLFNGWYIGVVSPSGVYYNDVRNMQLTLAVTGLVLALMFCAVLTFMHIAKNRSDEASKVKSSFLANMSHEIRTPMNAVIGMTEILMHEQLTTRQASYVNDINTSARSLLSIINDILDLSKIESGKLTLSPVNYDFHALLDNINSMFKYVAQQKNIDFRFESSGELPRTLFGDDIRLRQVLTNLCGNAVKFTDDGYVRLKVSLAGDKLIFEIKDTGVGIHKEDIPKLFNAFQQAQTSKNRGVVGTGLGLAISKIFVEMMGGSITLESEYGQGTVITVILPATEGDADEVRREGAGNEKKEQEIIAPGARILVVDDNEFNLTVASGLLNLFQIDADVADSGKKALEILAAGTYDVVFMDHMMPEMDGLETTAAIRALGGAYADMPVIALTANAIQGAKEMFLANGFNGFISKPIDLGELSEMLVEFLPKRKIAYRAGAAVSHANTQPAGPAGCRAEGQSGGMLASVGEIYGINVEIGLSRVSGIEGMYVENLRLFQKKLLSECGGMAASLESGDIKRFSISVHAMKSILSTVGAMELSDAAFKLETASKNGDADFCGAHFPAFFEEMAALHEKLSALFPEKPKPRRVTEPGDAAHLMDTVRKALEAADNFDNDAGLEALCSLKGYDFGEQVEGLLDGAAAAFEEYDYDKAVETLGKIAV